MSAPKSEPWTDYREYPEDEMLRRAREFHDDLSRRRTVREFSDRPVPGELIRCCLAAAVSAPSGANRRPWHFVAVRDPATKATIRRAAEREEAAFYGERAPDDWLEALRPLGTDEHKPFLETAPWLIAVFAELHGVGSDGARVKNYYVKESVGIATGFLLAALHRAGLATLTHTPAPMRFLNEILARPSRERPFLILVAGYPADGVRVPAIERKPFDDMVTIV